MIQIQELLQLTLFDDFKLVSGKEGLNREMESIVILEYESFRNTYEVFDEKDFVLSSLFFAKDDPALIEEALMNLMKREVAGIAIKTVFFTELPEKVLKASEQKKIPIFLFQNAYMEDLIISANELLKSKLQYLVLEEKIKKLLERQPLPKECEMTAYEINPYFGEKLATAYLRPKNSRGESSLVMNFGRLAYKRFQTRGIQDYAYVKYRDGMFLIFTIGGDDIEGKRRLEEILKHMELRLEQYDIGLSGVCRKKEELYVLLEQALLANRVCQVKNNTRWKKEIGGAKFVCFSSMGSFQYIASMLEHEALQEICREKIACLNTYDETHSSDLLKTLEFYVEWNGDIAETARRMFQHPNTIRYRLKKARNLLECEEEDFYIYLVLLIRMYQLENYSRI